MRNTRWLRFGVTSVLFAGLSMTGLLVACSDDETTPTPNPTEDGGSDAGKDATSPTDGGSDDAETPDASKPTFAKLTLINAATDLGTNANVDEATKFQAVRICYGTKAGDQVIVVPTPALPTTAPTGLTVKGLYIGTGGVVPTINKDVDLGTLAITPFVLNAAALERRGVADKDCATLLNKAFDAGDGPLVENVDYWQLPEIAKGTLAQEKSFALVLSGCAGDAVVEPAAKCGEGFTSGAPGLGTLKVSVLEIDRATKAEADAVGTQFIHASPAAKAVLTNDGTPIPIIPGYVSEGDGGADGGANFLPATDATAAGVEVLAAPGALKQVKGVDFAGKFTPNGLIEDPTFQQLARPLAEIEKISGLAAGTYANGKSFTFVFLGDPSAPPTVTVGENTIGNIRAAHFIGIENDPVVKDLSGN